MSREKDFQNNRRRKKQGRRVYKDKETTKDGKVNDMDTSPRTNDLSWYTINDQLLNDAGSLSFNNPLGNSTRITELTNFGTAITYNNTANLDRAIPGVMAIHYIPTIGPSEDNYSAINVAAKGLYSSVRASNSGAKNYDPADLMKYLMALDSAYSYFAFLARIYGVARIYSAVNRYWPVALLKAMGVDIDDIRANLADLRYYINVTATRLNTLCAPSHLRIFDRHFMMNMGVWKDGDFDKAQIYAFIPDVFYQYDEFNQPDAPAQLFPLNLQGYTLGSPTLKVKDLISMGDTLISPLLGSEDIGIISGDLFKRYGMDGSHTLNMIPEDFQVFPVYDETVLHQIHNIRYCGKIEQTDSLVITELTSQDSSLAGALVQTIKAPINAANTPVHSFAHPLDFRLPLESINAGAVMEASRLTALGDIYIENNLPVVLFKVYGSEICTYACVWATPISGGDPTILRSLTNGSANAQDYANHSSVASSFDLHPIIFAGEWSFANLSYDINPVTPANYDYNNYTIVGKSSLRKLHEAALLALYNMPAQGMYV